MPSPLPGSNPGEVWLRDVQPDDLPIFFEQQLDPDATHMAAFPSRGREAFMAHWNKILGDPPLALQTILYNGQVAGNMVCWEQGGKPLLGYWLSASHSGAKGSPHGHWRPSWGR